MKSKVNFLLGITLPLIIAAGCASEPPGAVAVADKDPERIICRNEAPVGSRLPKRNCKSAREWDAIAAENQEAGRNLQRGAIRPSEAGGLQTGRLRDQSPGTGGGMVQNGMPRVRP